MSNNRIIRLALGMILLAMAIHMESATVSIMGGVIVLETCIAEAIDRITQTIKEGRDQ